MKKTALYYCIEMTIFVILKPHLLMDITTKHTPKNYQAPAMRVIDTRLETSFLQSNLEPIDGGDDPDIDW